MNSFKSSPRDIVFECTVYLFAFVLLVAAVNVIEIIKCNQAAAAQHSENVETNAPILLESNE
jgi:hypothetical protein